MPESGPHSTSRLPALIRRLLRPRSARPGSAWPARGRTPAGTVLGGLGLLLVGIAAASLRAAARHRMGPHQTPRPYRFSFTVVATRREYPRATAVRIVGDLRGAARREARPAARGARGRIPRPGLAERLIATFLPHLLQLLLEAGRSGRALRSADGQAAYLRRRPAPKLLS